MPKNPTAITLILLAAGALQTGCVSYTSVKDEPRKSIQFASAAAAQTFYDAYLGASHPSVEKNTVCLYLSLPYRHYSRSTENVRFNKAVLAADLDKNGIISESEAAAYAKPAAKPKP